MSTPRIVPRSEWLVARTQLLEQEKELTRRRDRLASVRHEMPMVEIDKPYRSDAAPTMRCPTRWRGCVITTDTTLPRNTTARVTAAV
ncbi:DUF899 family protein [Mycobacterium sp. E3198]|uniref:DUF899 family protein n=1 Tax=Mycobacterium sp. E3198 TaxID=1834143 RepID=UPI0007FEB132|nr:DUF899 family protein [Mycobacterium sp. E3198]OBG39696.1 hypothetical protein A5673_12175 [Mycobacterium sp. E3198]